MTKDLRRLIAVLSVLVLFGAAACGDDDGSNGEAGGDPDQAATGGGGGGGGGREGELVLGDETITLSSGLCHLQPEDISGSEGTMLVTAQARGTNAAGEPVMVDFTRYDEDSRFAGDDINLVIGDYTSDDSQSYFGRLDIGGVNRVGDTFSATDVSFRGEAGEVVGSFRIQC